MAERVDKNLVGHAIDKGIDHISIHDVGELIVLLGEALDVLLKGLVGPLPIGVEVPCVLGLCVHTLEVSDEDGAEVSLAANAVRMELLKPSPGRA